MKTKSTEELIAKMSQVQLLDAIIDRMQDQKMSDNSLYAADPFIKEFAKRNGFSFTAAMLYAAFFNSFCDAHIEIRDIARFYDCNQVKILSYWSAIEEIVQRKYISQFKDRNGDVTYSIPNDVIVAIRENRLYTPKAFTNLDIDQWLSAFSDLLHKKNTDGVSYDNFLEDLHRLINDNLHLIIARELAEIKNETDLIILCAMLDLFIVNHDDHIIRTDIEDIFEFRWEARSQARRLESGSHPLQKAGLVEYSTSEGHAEKDAWQLTTSAKERFLVEIDTSSAVTENRDMKAADTIVPKQLFFNAAVSKQIAQLESLLREDRFAAVQENLVRHGMRRGFACIFYGAPGTGKTETVLQLARKTGRGIMIVDVPNLRDKFVGETEKNTKAIFEKYRRYCKEAKIAPILLFNEADAVLCKRNEGATGSVDKMENAMQNIILQEMENLDGIMIATTNLTGNLDAAFERRFLYKIEFPKPTPNESRHIWHAMLPEISEGEAYELAKQYAFSGGQIENIARKQIVNAVLTGEDRVSMEAIQEACKTELFRRTESRKIGF